MRSPLKTDALLRDGVRDTSVFRSLGESIVVLLLSTMVSEPTFDARCFIDSDANFVAVAQDFQNQG